MNSPSRLTALIEALTQLDAESREIILLSDVMGLSRSEVATRLGLSQRGAGRRLELARFRLQFSGSCKQTNP